MKYSMETAATHNTTPLEELIQKISVFDYGLLYDIRRLLAILSHSTRCAMMFLKYLYQSAHAFL